MDIKIKLHSVMDSDKTNLTKEEIRENLQKIVDIIAKNEEQSKLLQKMADEIAEKFQGKISRDFNLDFNRRVAGLMGATCYMPDTFETLNKKPLENILNIAGLVENNRHHSTFGHSFLTLQISGIPKALAMVLNNEKDYNTSEKSARYTKMKDIEPTQNALYNKWVEIFKEEIQKKHPNGSNNFFDAEGKKAGKLAQENARYLISVFVPTNMVYTTNFRQLNYLAHFMEKQIKNPSNNFYRELIPYMQEFVDFCKNNDLYSEKLEDGKDRGLSLFGEPVLKTNYSNTYQGMYKMSFACLAQSQRHRTIDFSINNLTFVNDFEKINDFYIPPIILDNPKLKEEYLKDIKSVAKFLPQGTLIDVNEMGTYENFILKAKERLCACAQKEIRDLTLKQTIDYSKALSEEASKLKDEQLANAAKRYSDRLKVMSSGARCKSGYKCTSPCGYLEGINLESDI